MGVSVVVVVLISGVVPGRTIFFSGNSPAGSDDYGPMRLRATVAALAVLVTACGGSDGSTTSPKELAIDGAWARTTPPGAVDGVVYLTVTSPTADAIVGASVPRSVADAAELHESMGGAGGEGMANMPNMADGDGGAMTMVPLAKVPLRAGETVAFEPGGKHIMLKAVTEPLVAGRTFTLLLNFARAGLHEVTVTVRDNAP